MQPLAPAGGANPDATKDPLLRHAKHGANILQIRKELAFKGWTFKAPIRIGSETRYGHMSYLSSGGSSTGSTETIVGHGQESGQMVLEGLERGREGDGVSGGRVGTVRSRALSL